MARSAAILGISGSTARVKMVDANTTRLTILRLAGMGKDFRSWGRDRGNGNQSQTIRVVPAIFAGTTAWSVMDGRGTAAPSMLPLWPTYRTPSSREATP